MLERCCTQDADKCCSAEEKCCGRVVSRPCCVFCAVRKVVVQNRKASLPSKDSRPPFRLLWSEWPPWPEGKINTSDQVVTVELTPLGAPELTKRTEAGVAANHKPSENVWVWGVSKVVSFPSMQTSTEFLLRVLRSGREAESEVFPPEVLGSGRFTVDDDVATDAGINGLLELPIVLDDRVCGTVSLIVSAKCTDGFPLDCGLPQSHSLHPNFGWPPSDARKLGLEWIEEQEGTLWSPRAVSENHTAKISKPLTSVLKKSVSIAPASAIA